MLTRDNLYTVHFEEQNKEGGGVSVWPRYNHLVNLYSKHFRRLRSGQDFGFFGTGAELSCTANRFWTERNRRRAVRTRLQKCLSEI
jgi:hypothetical protein